MGEFINFGKSAVVAQAVKGNSRAAIKIFDPELVEKYGREVQQERINREKDLIGVSHSNLVEIFDGGYDADLLVFYVVMEFLPWKNLADTLESLPRGIEETILVQLAKAAEFLEGRGICHRDIKPSNIAISPDWSQIKLLDLGVIRPIGASSATEGIGGKHFVGTLRYSPPELLLGQVQEPDGWRAVTFYQIGAVLHDLIVRRPLFGDFQDPFPLLIAAVREVQPEIPEGLASPDLIELTQSCLVKKSETRLSLIDWARFDLKDKSVPTRKSLREKILKRTILKNADKVDEEADGGVFLDEVLDTCATACRMAIINEPLIFPPLELHNSKPGLKTRGFTIYFDPSDSHTLKFYQEINFKIELSEFSDKVINIAVGSIVSKVQFKGDANSAAALLEIFMGVFNTSLINDALINILYVAIEEAQRIQMSSSTANVPLLLSTFNS